MFIVDLITESTATSETIESKNVAENNTTETQKQLKLRILKKTKQKPQQVLYYQKLEQQLKQSVLKKAKLLMLP